MGWWAAPNTFVWHRKFSFLTKHKDIRSSNRSILRRSSYENNAPSFDVGFTTCTSTSEPDHCALILNFSLFFLVIHKSSLEIRLASSCTLSLQTPCDENYERVCRPSTAVLAFRIRSTRPTSTLQENRPRDTETSFHNTRYYEKFKTWVECFCPLELHWCVKTTRFLVSKINKHDQWGFSSEVERKAPACSWPLTCAVDQLDQNCHCPILSFRLSPSARCPSYQAKLKRMWCFAFLSCSVQFCSPNFKHCILESDECPFDICCCLIGVRNVSSWSSHTASNWRPTHIAIIRW